MYLYLTIGHRLMSWFQQSLSLPLLSLDGAKLELTMTAVSQFIDEYSIGVFNEPIMMAVKSLVFKRLLLGLLWMANFCPQNFFCASYHSNFGSLVHLLLLVGFYVFFIFYIDWCFYRNKNTDQNFIVSSPA